MQIPAFVAAILMGTILDPKKMAITFIIFLVTLPVLILDTPWHIILDETIWTIIFIIFVALFKVPSLFYTDVIHCLLAYACAILATLIVLNSRLESISNYSKMLLANTTDKRTGLYNDTYFIEQAKKKLDEEDLYGHAYILQYDFHGMRFFNKSKGYDAGDRLLVKFADCLRAVYSSCLIARFGEDHFVVLCKEHEWRHPHELLRYMMDHYFVEQYSKHLCYTEKNKNGQRLRIQLHCGICLITEEESLPTTCEHARVACHNVKDDSYDQVREYDRELSENTEMEWYILNHIDEAVEKHYLQVYYQPVFRAMSGKLCSEEALSRWQDPHYGLLPPSRFIPILEENKQLYKVDLYAIEQVLKDFQAKEEAGIQIVSVSINLSRYDFMGRDMVKIISDLIDQYHLARKILKMRSNVSMRLGSRSGWMTLVLATLL